MSTIEELAAELGTTPEELKEHLATIGLATTRNVAVHLADADAVEKHGFAEVLQDPEIEPEHWRKALQQLGARLDQDRPTSDG